MLFTQLQKLWYPKKVVALEIHLGSNNDLEMHLLIAQMKKGQLLILEKATFLKNYEAVKALIPSNTPLILVLNGKGILHKKVESIPKNHLDIPGLFLPGANPIDFCYQIQNAEFPWISLVRVALLNKILQDLEVHQIPVVQLRIGFFGIQNVFGLIEEKFIELTLGNILITVENQEIISYQKNRSTTSEDIKIGEESIPNYLLTPFAVAFQYLLHIPTQIFNAANIDKSQKDFKYHLVFRKAALFGLSGLFCLLLINFLTFSWLNDNTQNQLSKLTYHQNQLTQLDSLQQRYANQQVFFQHNSLLKPSKTSYFADQIAASIPKGIQLSELNLFPSTASQKQQREQLYLFDSQVVMVKGICERSTALNLMIKNLEALNWIDRVKVMPYLERDGQGEFELHLIF